VDKNEARQGIGRALISDGMKRAAKAARIIGAGAFLVHPLDDEAISFYERLDFRRLSKETQKMFIAMKTIQQEIGL
jgi:ribosomal protein S18 acetylase RimI-like enzyme